MISPSRYYHTAIYLKPSQIYGRIAFKLSRPKISLCHPEIRPAKTSGTWVRPISKPPSIIGPRTFRFLKRTGEVAKRSDWNNAAEEKLWLYNLHYFDDITSCGAETRRAWHVELINRWINDNPPTFGNGWEPYPTSLRIVNWIKFAVSGASSFPQHWLESLALQAKWLERRLEWHLLGNHLFANAKALVFAGLFFEGPSAAKWLEKGLNVLETQVAEQILADGGHFELSPMYHAIVLEDLLDLINLSRAYPSRVSALQIDRLVETSGQMRRWLATMTHPDGQIALFNDAAFSVAPLPAELEAYAIRLGLNSTSKLSHGLHYLPKSGYIRWEGDDAVAILDVAAIGPDYLPGHAHADSLSFELSIAGNRVIINGGTSTYQKGLQRQQERGTRAHSTVTVDNSDSSEVWSAFRVARRARIKELDVTEFGDSAAVTAAHDGYLRLGGGVVHRRKWTFDRNTAVVRDEVSGSYEVSVARFHIGPCIRVGDNDQGRREFTEGRLLGARCTIKWFSNMPAALEPSRWHPEFGSTVDTVCVVVPVPRAGAEFSLLW